MGGKDKKKDKKDKKREKKEKTRRKKRVSNEEEEEERREKKDQVIHIDDDDEDEEDLVGVKRHRENGGGDGHEGEPKRRKKEGGEVEASPSSFSSSSSSFSSSASSASSASAAYMRQQRTVLGGARCTQAAVSRRTTPAPLPSRRGEQREQGEAERAVRAVSFSIQGGTAVHPPMQQMHAPPQQQQQRASMSAPEIAAMEQSLRGISALVNRAAERSEEQLRRMERLLVQLNARFRGQPQTGTALRARSTPVAATSSAVATPVTSPVTPMVPPTPTSSPASSPASARRGQGGGGEGAGPEARATVFEENECVACTAAPPQLTFGCGHKCMCSECCAELAYRGVLREQPARCPMCRKPCAFRRVSGEGPHIRAAAIAYRRKLEQEGRRRGAHQG
eukprot:TRINITY_DN2751_c1_g2_i1.p1 TRINITY_DN2751_c1_g2~~TRINITY_DN2751_c1_g2_i1.p1  ORF type:complete len:393 (-),score=90.11 TRINITY_DN2751_c1_g2_i1:124-1302(-)